MRPATLADWLAYVETLHPKSIALGLDRVASVAQRMSIGIECPVITVGGTNGKGSTCAMLEAIYRHAGFRTGLYTSPHLLRFNERVRILGMEASDAALAAAFDAVETARISGAATEKRAASVVSEDAPTAARVIPLTYFEFSTLAALALFAKARLDVLVLEVGLGGRLDAVNLVDADVAVITTVGIDHIDYLGSTRDAIGREKAGIFRDGSARGLRRAESAALAHAITRNRSARRCGRSGATMRTPRRVRSGAIGDREAHATACRSRRCAANTSLATRRRRSPRSTRCANGFRCRPARCATGSCTSSSRVASSRCRDVRPWSSTSRTIRTPRAHWRTRWGR